ncbi:MAG TPA: Hsp20/alpha crystallin family protein [Conexibacter sp.]|nr:Hsp20/alpha crystallin family protein [Conexibacter sp.]
MPSERDLFANFERMRREMDELFGDVFHRSGIAPRKRAGFSPAVDVSYADDPPRAIVTAELAGIDADRLGLEIQGRELVLSGERRATEREGRVYQQVEIEHGPFRRVVQLGADVRAEEAKAVYEDGLLRVELPLAQPEPRPHSVPIEVSQADPTDVAPGQQRSGPPTR